MIYLLYGQPGSGKTSLGKLLASHLDTPFIIDGDELREMFTNTNYGREGREENIRNANAVATYLNKKGKDVVMSVVSPYKHLRGELKNRNAGQVVEVMLSSRRDLRKEYHVEDFEKGSPDCIVRTDQDLRDSWDYLKTLLQI
jgi:adenylylsulfate kinase